MRRMRAGRWLAATVLCLVGLPGCTDNRAVDGDSVQPTATAVATEAADASTPAARLRLRLEHQFGAFGSATLEATRVVKGERRAAQAAVRDTIADLTATTATVYDDDEADGLEDQLTAWSDAISAYADTAKSRRDSARERLDTIAAGVAELMARSTRGAMAADGTAALIRGPLRTSANAIDAYQQRDFDRAYTLMRSAHADMTSVGQAFGAGIGEHMPDRYTGQRSSGPVELQSALQQLLIEHAWLATTVTRRGARAARDFDAAAAALNGNTEDIATALDAYYGSATSPVVAAWRDRISLLADYTVATAEERPRRARETKQQLQRADDRLGRLLDDLSDGNVAAEDGEDSLRALTTQLLKGIDAYVAKDYSAANAVVPQALDAAAGLASVLAEGIVAHRPEDFDTP